MGPNPNRPYRIHLPSFGLQKIQDFETDEFFVPSIARVEKEVVFDLEKGVFIKEVLKVGTSRDFHNYRVKMIDISYAAFFIILAI